MWVLGHWTQSPHACSVNTLLSHPVNSTTEVLNSTHGHRHSGFCPSACGVLTVARVRDWAGGSKIDLQEWVLVYGNVGGDHIAGAGLFNEDKGVACGATHGHLGASRVQQPLPAVQGREIIFQDCIARDISSNENLKCILKHPAVWF